MGAGVHGGFGSTKGYKNAAAGTTKLVNNGYGSDFGTNALKAKPEKGYTDVIVHGEENNVAFYLNKANANGNQEYVKIDQRRLAKYIKNTEKEKVKAIRLISCNTGKLDNGFAQNLANKMHVPVKAPNDIIWAHSDGKLTIGPNAYTNTGKWRLFYPKKTNGGR